MFVTNVILEPSSKSLLTHTFNIFINKLMIKDQEPFEPFENLHFGMEERGYKTSLQIKTKFTMFDKKSEGRHGVVVTFLASLELAKDGHVELIQNKTDEIFLKSVRGEVS